MREESGAGEGNNPSVSELGLKLGVGEGERPLELLLRLPASLPGFPDLPVLEALSCLSLLHTQHLE